MRAVRVTPERLAGWIERFGARHGVPQTARADRTITLTAPDGAVAEYLEQTIPDPFGIVLARRGGYAVGLIRGGQLVDSKCGTRYVQGTTKAGGWSQQRYARRRANQADELVDACARAIDKVLAGQSNLAVFGGGDRRLVNDAVVASRTRPTLTERWLDVPDPRLAVLEDAVGQARSVVIKLNELA